MIKIWDPKGDFKCIHTLEGHTDRVHGFIRLESGCYASGSYDKTVKIWDLEDGSCLHSLKGDESMVRSLDQLDKGHLAVGYFNGIWVWSSDFKTSQVIKDGRCVLGEFQGKIIGYSRTDSIKVWELG